MEDLGAFGDESGRYGHGIVPVVGDPLERSLPKTDDGAVQDIDRRDDLHGASS